MSFRNGITPGILALLVGCATPRPGPETPIVDLTKLSEGAMERDGDLVIKIPAGTRLPIHVQVGAPFVVSGEGAPTTHLVFSREVYWYPRAPKQISFDGKTWNSVHDLCRGELKFGVSNSARHGARADFSLRLEPKK
ncbi:MAG: hypothetical protein ACYTGV_05995 [Planctomycetota bacterium]|jgi:hypothetical protein